MTPPRTEIWSNPEQVDRIIREATAMRNAYLAGMFRGAGQTIVSILRRGIALAGSDKHDAPQPAKG